MSDTTADVNVALKDIWKKSGYGGSDKLYKVARKEGLTVSHKEVEKFLANQKTSQLHKRTTKKASMPITTTNPHIIYQMDLLDMTKFYRSNRGYKWILICTDVFTRKSFAYPLKSKSPDDVVVGVKTCFAEMGKPEYITTDDGSEWKGEVREFLKREDVGHRTTEVGDHNVLGIIDRFSKTLKDIVYKHFTHDDTTDWISVIDELIKNYNNTPHSTLKGETPNEAEKYPFDTAMMHYERIRGIQEKSRPIITSFNVGDYVRYKLKKGTFTKGYEQKYSDTVHKIVDKNGGNYTLDNGMTFRWQGLQKIDDVAPQQEIVEKKRTKTVREKIDESKRGLQSERRRTRENRSLSNIITEKRSRSIKNYRDLLG